MTNHERLRSRSFENTADVMEALLRFQDTLETHTLTQVNLFPIEAKRVPVASRNELTLDDPVQSYQL